MIWTQSQIERLKEDDLSRQVLIPLFTAMGYQDVRFHGGGILEQGKDITMWRQQEPRGRINAAAVVKAIAITGEAGTAMVISQLRQAFAVPFQDVLTGASQRVHECFVITSAIMKKEGVHTLRNVIEAEPFARHVTTIDGTGLWELIGKHLGPRVTLGAVLENYRRLNSHETLEVGIQLETGRTGVTVRSRTGEPIELNMPTFSDTAEGTVNRVAFERFLLSGETAELNLAHLSDFAPTEIASELGFATGSGVVRLTANPLLGMAGDLCCRSESGEEVTIPNLEFTATGGTAELVLTNANQDVPLHFEIRIAFNGATAEGATATFDMNADCAGWSIYWYVLYLQFMRVTSRTGTATIRERKTGIEHRLGSLTLTGLKPPTQYHYDLARRILYVQDMTKQPILVPKREFFTDEDVANLVHVEEIVTEGRHKAEAMHFRLVATDANDTEWIRRLNQPVTNAIVRASAVQRLVLDTWLSLGPAEFKCTKGTMLVEDIETASKAALQGDPVPVRIIPSKKGRIIATYSWWKRGSRRRL